ncbi:MAG: anthranilate synthase component II, partial [Halanaerobiales bacterium]
MVLVIDNYDSFTYNLVQYLGEFSETEVFRNDRITVEQVKEMAPEQIVISPGPGRPEDAGISLELIDKLKGEIPILGVCLGHQCIAQALGGSIIKAERLFHGKVSSIHLLAEDPVFTGVASPFTATRYHSLIVKPESLPSSLEVLAETEAGEIMAFRHRKYPLYGMQFHPESVLT